MNGPDLSAAPEMNSAMHGAYRTAYRAFAYAGLMTLFGSLLAGFRYAMDAPTGSYGFNALLYGVFIVPHLVMTRSWFKRAMWGDPAGSPRERRFYIFVTIVMWIAVYGLHRPVPGVVIASPPWWLTLTGAVLLLFGFLLFFQGVTLPMLDGLLGVPGSVSAYSHGAETPLFTEGSYASVRHPMYRAFLIGALGSVLMHPHAGQVFWAIMLVGTFVIFIPVEEAQLLRARGDDYRSYMERTRWRLIRGIW